MRTIGITVTLMVRFVSLLLVTTLLTAVFREEVVNYSYTGVIAARASG